MPGINTGILHNAYPLSTERIKELEKQVLENQETFAYLDENSELCFSMSGGVDVIKDLAWNTAYELISEESGFIKRIYKKNGLKTYYLYKVLHKENMDDSWAEPSDFPAPGLYETGSNYGVLVTSWDELIANEVVHVEDGAVYTNVTPQDMTNSSSDALAGDLVLPNDGSITKVGTVNMEFFEGNMGFALCENLTSVKISDSVTTLGYGAFIMCPNLKSVEFGKNSQLTTLEPAIFMMSGIEKFEIPETVQYIGDEEGGSFICMHLVVPNKNFYTLDGASPATISACGYFENYSPNVIAAPATDPVIGGCRITEYKFGPTTGHWFLNYDYTYIDKYTFTGTMDQLAERWYNDKVYNNYTYRNSRPDVIHCSDGILAVQISGAETPDGATAIIKTADYRYEDALNVSASVTRIYPEVCGRYGYLTDITYEGTVAQWQNIILDDNWNSGEQITVTCTDGVIAADGTITYN